MKKNLALALIFLLQLGFFPLNLQAQTETTSEEDLVEDRSISEDLPSWNITDLKFPKGLMTNKKTKKKVIPITATFEYQTADENDYIKFPEDYIWSLHCAVTEGTGDNLKALFDQQKTFPVKSSLTDMDYGDGARAKSTVFIEFDQSLVKELRRKKNMVCSLGFAKPVDYEFLKMGLSEGLYMSYILKLRGNRWEIKGWDF